MSDVPFLILAGVAFFAGIVLVAYPFLVPSVNLSPSVAGLALVCWGGGVLMTLLSVALRRLSHARPEQLAEPPAGDEASKGWPFWRSHLDAVLLTLAGVSFFIGFLLIAYPSFVPFPYLTPSFPFLGAAFAFWGCGILLLFLGLAATRVREISEARARTRG